MHNTLIISIYAPLSIVTAVIFAIELFRHYKRQEDYCFTLLCFYALAWYALNIWGLLTNNIDTAKYCIHVMILFVALIPPTLLLFIIKFYKYEFWDKLPKQSVVLLFIIPAITGILAVIAPLHNLLICQLDIISLSPLREMVIVWGPWFWVHTAYSYLLSIIIIVLTALRHSRATGFDRLPSLLIVLGVCVTLIGNLLTLFQLIPPVIEPTLICMSFSLIFFSLAIFNNSNSKFVRFSRAHIYNYLTDYMLILDEKNYIIDYNKAAGAWFNSQDIALDNSSFEAVKEALLQKGELVYRFIEEDKQEHKSVDICIKDNMFSLVLNQCVYQMHDARGNSIGKIVVYSDVTQNRMLIERLETKAGVDSLTGIANRMAYTGIKNRMDSREFLPLSVIVCDVNGLKEVNDSLGHSYGDLLLQTIASVLEAACPKDAFVARIGGDEFVFLLPCSTTAVADALIKQIKRKFLEINDVPFALSMAFGVATKYEEGQLFDEVIILADKRMYQDKRSYQ